MSVRAVVGELVEARAFKGFEPNRVIDLPTTGSRTGRHKRFRTCIWQHSLATRGAPPLSRASFTCCLGGTEKPSTRRERSTPLSTKVSGKVLHPWLSTFRREGLVDHHEFHSSDRFGLIWRNELRTQWLQL